VGRAPFERFARFRDIVTDGLGAHGERALQLHPPQPGDRVLDIGCGFGDTAHRIAGLVGPQGHVLGVDAAPRFIESARDEYGAANVRFEVADVERTTLGEGFDLAFSRRSSPTRSMRCATCARRCARAAGCAWSSRSVRRACTSAFAARVIEGSAPELSASRSSARAGISPAGRPSSR
jgi:SAM-dependent methyltransferase